MTSIKHRPLRGGQPATLRRHAALGLLAAGLVCLAFAQSALAFTFPITFTPVAGSPFKEQPNTRQVVFSPGGGLLATNSNTGFALQQVSTAGAVSASPSGGATSLSCPSKGNPAVVVESESIAFSPDGKVIAEVEQGQGNKPPTPKGFLRTYSVSKSGAVTPDECLTDIGGAPPGEGPIYSDAFSPAAEGGLLAVTSTVTNSVYVFSVTGAGKVYPLPGSPFPTGKEPDAVTFSPAGSGFDLLATANRGDPSVSMFTVGSSVVAPVAGSPFATAATDSLAFSPNSGLLAIAGPANKVSVFSVSFGGELTPVSGSPFSTAATDSVAFSPGGSLLAIAGPANQLSAFSVSSAGALTPLSSSPFTTGPGPSSVAFSSDGFLLANANDVSNTTSVFSYGSSFIVVLPPGIATLVNEAFQSLGVGAGRAGIIGLIDRALGEVGWGHGRPIATVHLVFAHAMAGRRVVAETVAFVMHDITHKVAISQHNRLTPGLYRLVVTATAAGGLRSIPQSLPITIAAGNG